MIGNFVTDVLIVNSFQYNFDKQSLLVFEGLRTYLSTIQVLALDRKNLISMEVKHQRPLIRPKKDGLGKRLSEQ
jgi:hypothetical protein